MCLIHTSDHWSAGLQHPLSTQEHSRSESHYGMVGVDCAQPVGVQVCSGQWSGFSPHPKTSGSSPTMSVPLHIKKEKAGKTALKWWFSPKGLIKQVLYLFDCCKGDYLLGWNLMYFLTSHLEKLVIHGNKKVLFVRWKEGTRDMKKTYSNHLHLRSTEVST